jgi:hypothetical protein
MSFPETPGSSARMTDKLPYDEPGDESALVRSHGWTIAVIAFMQHQRAAAAVAWHVTETRAGRFLAPALIALLAAGEVALAYQGLILALPAHRSGHSGWLLELVQRNGAMLAAIAVGLGSAVGATVVGYQLRKAGRGTLIDPQQTTDRR